MSTVVPYTESGIRERIVEIDERLHEEGVTEWEQQELLEELRSNREALQEMHSADVC